ncbi:hypothetical protein DMA15_22700 [Streptomyces sp. WAC 01529]|nr:hypothetical protein DMA15_22700 [Streptomyces sp. WAC 01529]
MNGRAGHRGRWVRAAALSLAMGAAVGTLASCGSDRPVTYSGGTFDDVDRAESTTGDGGRDGGAASASAEEVRGRKLGLAGMELLKSADTVRIGVEMKTAKGRQKVSLHMDRENNCTGTFDAGPAQQGDFIMIAGGAMYVRFDDAALDAMGEMGDRRGPEAGARVRERTALARGKYLKIPAGSGTRGPAIPMGSCDLDKITEKIGTTELDEVIEARPTTRRYGEDVTPLVEKEDGGETTVYVAASGEPYILGVEATKRGGTGGSGGSGGVGGSGGSGGSGGVGGSGGSGGEQTMKMRLSDYDEPVAAVAPAPAATLDISRIGPGGPGGGLFEV